MIYTASHKNWNSDEYRTVSISGNRGKDANYTGECFPELAPKLSFWKIWHDNIGVIPEKENIKYYIEQYYLQVLLKLDPLEVYDNLENSVLLCYEENTEFCHRHIVAEWLQLTLGVVIPEATAINYDIEKIGRPEYIRIYLEEVINKYAVQKRK